MDGRWRDAALPSDFTDAQAREEGCGREWAESRETLKHGRRWRIFAEHLGLQALLMIDTTDRNTYFQRRLPMPVFVAWTQLIPRVDSGG